MVMTYIIVVLLHNGAQGTEEFTITFFEIIVVKDLCTYQATHSLTTQYLFLMRRFIMATISKQHELTNLFHGMPAWIGIIRYVSNTIIS